MTLPFSHEQFFTVFADYNETLWPLAAALWLLSLAALLAMLSGRSVDRATLWLLAAHWAWAGVAYHWAHFAAINPAALPFAGLFLFQALLLGRSAACGSVRFRWRWELRAVAGATMAIYALAYPGLAALWVGDYPRIPTFGVPCPTTLLTLGLLLMAQTTPPWLLLVIPLLWAAIGASAAVILDVTSDMALPAAAIVAVALKLAPANADPRL